jgi:uncharacterized protein YecE (DUF72 family)
MKKAKVYIGTSGWHYKHWKGNFYPEDTSDAGQFNYYINYFNTVEINNSFYMLPTAKTFSAWRETAPRNFIFSVKASRFITHMKKLKVDRNSIRKFFSRIHHLKEKLGPVLFQLPPRWKVNTERLKQFLQKLPTGYQYAFEFRDHSWYTNEVYQLLEKFNCAFCIYELEHHLSPLMVTADFVYVRLHGPGKKYQGNYTLKTLRKWKKQITAWQRNNKTVYVYFDNDQQGYAAFNAQALTDSKMLIQS